MEVVEQIKQFFKLYTELDHDVSIHYIISLSTTKSFIYAVYFHGERPTYV